MLTAAYDIDGTISAAANTFTDMMTALKTIGWCNIIVTGSNPDSVSGGTWDSKIAYLKSIGVTDCWDQLVIISVDDPALLAQKKAQWCQQNAVDVLFDNDKGNADEAVSAGIPLVLVPWATRERDGKKP